jgi:hypothetical protein
MMYYEIVSPLRACEQSPQARCQKANMSTKRNKQDKKAGPTPTFDGARLAYLEVAGLRAYYDRRWLACFRYLFRIAREQFGLSPLRALQNAYYFTRASLAWAPVDHRAEVTHDYIHKFYHIAKKCGKRGKGMPFNEKKVSDIEFQYWILHRERGNNPTGDPAPYIECLTALHSALFGLSTDQVRLSAVKRAEGTDHIDRVTGHRSTNIESDWRQAEAALAEAYTSIARQL